MNSQGWVRGMIAKNMDSESFLSHITTTISRQLSIWSDQYHVKLLADLVHEGTYYIIIDNQDKSYKVTLDKDNIELLQQQDPYAVDQYIWRTLQKQGLTIQSTEGSYLRYCAI